MSSHATYIIQFFSFVMKICCHLHMMTSPATSVTKEEESTDMFDGGKVRRQGNLTKQMHELYHRFDNPLSKACQTFWEATFPLTE